MPRTLSWLPADANLTGYASNVSGAAFTLTANAPTDGLAHQVTVRNDTANSKSGITLTLVGTDANGNPLTEQMAGPGASATVTTSGYFKTLTSVTPSATFGADTSDIGWANAVQSQVFNVNALAEDALAINIDVTGTINYTVQQTFDDLQGTPIWQTLPSAGSQTADGIWNTTGGVTGVRILINSSTAVAVMKVNLNATAVVNAPGAAGGGGGGQDVDIVSVGGTAVSNGVLPVQEAGNSFLRRTTEGQVKAGAGTLHTITISPNGSVTAGILTLYDSLTETGTVIASFSLPVTTFTAFSVTFDIAFATGLFVGFDATLANVSITASYR